MNEGSYSKCGYNLTGFETDRDRLAIYRSYPGFNLTYSYPIDFTDIKKIIIKGATHTNTANLSATAFYYIANTPVTSLDEAVLTEINRSIGENLSEFSAEIDCSGISGENHIHLAILHGTENAGMTSYLLIDSITFVYG